MAVVVAKFDFSLDLTTIILLLYLLGFQVNCAEKGPATIVIANVRYQDLENILHFMYRGQVNVRKEDLNKFLETGEQLQIDGLMGQGQNSKKQQQQQGNPAKRRFSEGGQVNSSGVRSAAQQIIRNGKSSLPQQQPQYKISTSSGSATGSVTSRVSTAGTNSQQNNHVDSAKKARVTSLGNVMLKEASVSNSSSVVRRTSTASSHVSNANSSSPTQVQKTEEDEVELGDSPIKIMSVAGSGYEAQGSEVYEILDYDGEEGGEMDLDG